MTINDRDAFNLDDLKVYGQIFDAVVREAPVSFVNNGREPTVGTLRSICAGENEGRIAAAVDIRDAFVRVTMRTGNAVTISMKDMAQRVRHGTIALNYDATPIHAAWPHDAG